MLMRFAQWPGFEDLCSNVELVRTGTTLLAAEAGLSRLCWAVPHLGLWRVASPATRQTKAPSSE